MGTRYEARTQIAQYFGGTTLQSVVDGNGPYINGPLNSDGLSAVYPRWAKRIPDENFFLFTQSTARAMGTVMVVHIPRLQERRIALSALTGTQRTPGGTRQDDMTVELHLYHLAQQNYAEPAEEDLEGMIDAILNLIDNDVTLGGVVVGAGEDTTGIQTILNPPVTQDAPERVEQYAKITFRCQFFFSGV